MPARVRLERAPNAPRQSYELSKAVSGALDLSLADARLLLARMPRTLPRSLTDDEANALAERLRHLGAEAHVVHPPSTLDTACNEHPQLDGVEHCRGCQVPLCVACAARPTPSGEPLCPKCAERGRRRERRYQARLVVWLLLLAVVCTYAVTRWWSRRIDWSEPTRVAFVLVTPSDAEIAPRAIDGIRERVPALQERLRNEASKYLPEGALPFELSLLGPVESDVAVPRVEGDSLWALGRFNFDLWRYAKSVDASGALDTDAFDVRIYVSARAPLNASRQSVEGASQEGGSLGVVEVELAPDSVDFGLFVAAHELFHTRGASDKYGSNGLALHPIGYAEPDLEPLYPQRGAELMARGRPLSPSVEAPPDHLEVLTVGAETAREIGWLSAGR